MLLHNPWRVQMWYLMFVLRNCCWLLVKEVSCSVGPKDVREVPETCSIPPHVFPVRCHRLNWKWLGHSFDFSTFINRLSVGTPAFASSISWTLCFEVFPLLLLDRPLPRSSSHLCTPFCLFLCSRKCPLANDKFIVVFAFVQEFLD